MTKRHPFEAKIVWTGNRGQGTRHYGSYDRTWDMVHDRPDDDPVKQRVVECHEALARLTHLQD